MYHQPRLISAPATLATNRYNAAPTRDWRRVMVGRIPMPIEYVQQVELPNGRRRITALHGKTAGIPWRHAASEVIRNIESGDLFYYYYLSPSQPVMVKVALEHDGSKYLKGSVDTEEPDSLLQLKATRSVRKLIDV